MYLSVVFRLAVVVVCSIHVNFLLAAVGGIV